MIPEILTIKAYDPTFSEITRKNAPLVAVLLSLWSNSVRLKILRVMFRESQFVKPPFNTHLRFSETKQEMVEQFNQSCLHTEVIYILMQSLIVTIDHVIRELDLLDKKIKISSFSDNEKKAWEEKFSSISTLKSEVRGFRNFIAHPDNFLNDNSEDYIYEVNRQGTTLHAVSGGMEWIMGKKKIQLRDSSLDFLDDIILFAFEFLKRNKLET